MNITPDNKGAVELGIKQLTDKLSIFNSEFFNEFERRIMEKFPSILKLKEEVSKISTAGKISVNSFRDKFLVEIKFNADKHLDDIAKTQDQYSVQISNMLRIIGMKQPRDEPECTNGQLYTFYEAI